jgi:hypothetical protein
MVVGTASEVVGTQTRAGEEGVRRVGMCCVGVGGMSGEGEKER